MKNIIQFIPTDDLLFTFFINLLQICGVDENSGTVKLRILENYVSSFFI